MAKKQGDIRFGVQFQVDKSGLNELKTSLQQLQNLTIKDLVNTSNTEKANEQLNKIKDTASKVAKALEESYNVKLDTTNLTKFQKTLQQSGLSLSQIKSEFMEAGIQGQIAFRNLATELATTNKYIKQSSQWLDKMADTLSNTVRWTVASSALNAVTGSVQKAFNYTQKLDKSLNDIVIVTGKSADEMDKFARKANDAAKALGATTTDYTKASLIYYQQGLSDQEVQARADVTTKVANVTGQSADTASEQLTAIWNGYKVSAQEAEAYIDKVSAVAATTAADLEELATGMSKVASAANIMGVDIDQLNAQLATIVSVTREAPESIGTALKTVYARMSDIEAGLDSETTLGEYTQQMESLGIKALDAKGNLRDMGDVVEEIGGKWGTFSRNQQVALAQVIAGTRQYSRMMALFDNWSMYESAKDTSKNSLGALEQQNDRYLDSMEAHLNQLSAAAEGLYDSLLDPKGLNKVIDGLTKVVELVDQMVQGLGGGGNLLMVLGSISLNVFNNQITKGISNTVRNAEGLVNNLKNANAQADLLTEILNSSSDDPRFAEIMKTADKLKDVSKLITDEEREQANLLLKKSVEMINQEDTLKEQKKTAEELFKALTGEQVDIAANGGLEKFNKTLEESRLEEVKFLSEFNELTNIQKDVDKTSRGVGALKGVVTKFQKADFENAPTSFVNADNQGIENDFYEPSEKTIQAIDKLAQKEEQLHDLLDERQKKLDEFYARNLEGLQFTKTQFEIFAESNLFDEQELAELKSAQKIIKDIQKEKTLDSSKVKEAQKAVELYSKAIDKTNKATQKAVSAANSYEQNLKKIKDAQENATASLNKFLKSLNLNQAVNGVVKLAGGLANVGTALNNIKNLGNIWSDESLTSGEKVLQTLTNISFTIPMFISGISSIKTSIQSVVGVVNSAKAAYLAWNTAAAAKVMLDKATAEDLQSEVFWQKVKLLLGKQQNADDIIAINTLIAKAKAGDMAAASELKQIAGEQAHVFSLKGLKAGLASATASVWSFTTSLLANPITWIVVGIAAAVGLLATAVIAGSKAYNKYNLALEESNKAMEHQKQVYEDVKKAYDDLKKSIEDYTESQKAIDELTEGTQEWRDAIIEANKEITELIQKYPQFAQYLETDGFGRMTLNKEGLDKVQQVAQNSMNLAYSQSLAASAMYNDAKGLATAETISHNSSYATSKTMLEGWGKSIITPWALVEQIVKKDAGAPSKDETSTEDILKIAERLNTVQGSGETIAEAARAVLGDGASNAQIRALEENSEEIKALSKQLSTNTKTNEVLNEQIMSGYLSQYTDYNETEYKGVIDEVMGDRYAEELEKQKSLYEDKGKFGGGKTDKEIQEAYAAMMVETGQWQSVQSTKNKGKNKGSYTYIDASGNVQSGVEIDDIVARTALAAYEAQKATGNEKDLALITNAIDKLANKLPASLEKAVLTSGFTGGGKGDVSALTGAEKKELAKLVQERALDINKDDAKALGYESVEAYYKAIEDAIYDYDLKSKELADKFVGIIGTDAWNALTLAQQETFSSWFDSFSTMETEAATEVLKAAGAQADKILDEVMNTDWSNDTDILDLSYALSKLVPDLNPETIDNFIAGLKKVNNVFGEFNLKSVQEEYKKVNSILSSLSETGDIISAEDFEILGDSYEEYFITMEDGTKKLIADAKELYDLIKGERIDSAEKDLRETYQKYQDYLDLKAQLDKTPQYINTDKTYDFSSEYAEISKYENVFKDKGKTKLKFTDENTKTAVFSALDKLYKSGLISEETYSSYYGDLTDNDHVWAETIDGIYTALTKNTNQNHTYTESATVVNSEWSSLTNQISQYSETVLKQKIQDSTENMIQVLGVDILDNSWDQLFADVEKTTELTEARNKLQSNFKQLYTNNDIFDLGSFDYYAKKELPRIQKEIQKLEVEYSNLQKAMDFSDNYQSQTKILQKQIETVEKLAEAEYDRIEGMREQNRSFKNELLSDFTDMHLQDLGIADADATFKAWEKNPELYADEIRAAVESAAAIGVKGTDEFLNKFNTYLENTESGIPDALSNYQDYVLVLLELNLEKFDQSLTKALQKKEAKTSFNDFIRSFYEDDAKLVARTLGNDIDAILNATNGSIWEIKKSFDALENIDIITAAEFQNIIDQELELADNQMTAAQKQQKIQELYNQATKELLTLQETLNQLEEVQITQMDEIAQDYADQISYLEEINSLYDHQISLAELVGKKNGETLEQYNTRIEGYYKAQENNLNTMRAKYQSEYEYWQDMLTATDAEGNPILTEGTDAYKNAQEKMLAAGKNAAALGVEYGQMVADNFKRTVENSVNELFDGLNQAKEELDWLRADAERYYNKVEAYFEVSKLEASIRKDLNESKSANAQRKIAEFLEDQVNSLRDIEKLSEADLKRAQAKYDLLQAQIALEEAQANKTQMRLVRGADGSYSYEYVADTGAIAEKEQEVLDAQQAIMDLDKEEVKNHFDEIYDIAQEFIDQYIDAFSDLNINAGEEKLLGSIWDSLVEQIGDTDKVVEKLRQSTQAAAEALGISDLENMTDVDLAKLFPELDSSMYDLYKEWMTNDLAFSKEAFEKLMTTDVVGAKTILETLGLATSDRLDSLGLSYNDLMTSTEEAIANGKTDLQELTKIVDGTKDAYDNMAASLRSVIREMTLANMIAQGMTDDEAKAYVDKTFPEIATLDTGGYTGEWGSEGKFLLAHEKELILNKTDTENILNAVDIIRNLQLSLDASVAGRLAEMMKSYNSSMQAWDDSKDWTIEQNIQINADFPNATDSSEIEKAFEELLNMAAQRVAQR